MYLYILFFLFFSYKQNIIESQQTKKMATQDEAAGPWQVYLHFKTINLSFLPIPLNFVDNLLFEKNIKYLTLGLIISSRNNLIIQ